MNTYHITLLRGDGIGPEIVREAVKVLDAAAARYGFALTYTDALLGGCAIDAAGTPLPEETVAACKAGDAVLLGAVGGYKWVLCRVASGPRRAARHSFGARPICQSAPGQDLRAP